MTAKRKTTKRQPPIVVDGGTITEITVRLAPGENLAHLVEREVIPLLPYSTKPLAPGEWRALVSIQLHAWRHDD